MLRKLKANNMYGRFGKPANFAQGLKSREWEGTRPLWFAKCSISGESIMPCEYAYRKRTYHMNFSPREGEMVTEWISYKMGTWLILQGEI